MSDVQEKRRVIIIGAGIAGISTGIYAQMNGYQSRIYELHNQPGGLMTAWKRKGYTVDGCIHWLTGSSPKYGFYKLWEEIGLLQGQEIFNPDLFSRYENAAGQFVNFYTDTRRLEAHWLEIAPEDASAIHEFCAAVRRLKDFDMEQDAPFPRNVTNLFKMVVRLPWLQKYYKMTMAELAAQFQNPLLREALTALWYPEMTAMGIVMTLGMLENKGAGYPIGGSMPMARSIEARYQKLGGEICYNSRVETILVEGGKAVGVRLVGGEEARADWVVSAADGHATIFDMLGGRYVDDKIRANYDTLPIFEPLVYIGLGLNKEMPELHGITGGITMRLDEPIEVVGSKVDKIGYSIYNFDPTLAPAGKTALKVMFETRYAPWKALAGEPEQYEAEKQRVALAVIDRLDKRFPGFASHIEMADVATPLTFERYTGNWQGSYEGFLPTPAVTLKGLPMTLPGLKNFLMVGQWVSPGGGLPSGVLTGRSAVKQICKADGRKFRAVRG